MPFISQNTRQMINVKLYCKVNYLKLNLSLPDYRRRFFRNSITSAFPISPSPPLAPRPRRRTRVAADNAFYYFVSVSATEIINDLPKLSESERRAVRRKLVELAAENQDVAACDQSALEGAMMLDQMEADDARHQSR